MKRLKLLKGGRLEVSEAAVLTMENNSSFKYSLILTISFILTIAFIIAGCSTNMTLYQRGDAYLKNGDYDNAINSFKAVLERNPNDPSALSAIGIAYYNKGNYNDAISHLERAKKADPVQIEPYIYLGMSNEQLGQYEKAMSEYNDCLALKPDKSVVKRIEKRKSFLSREVAKTTAEKALQNEAKLVNNVNNIPDNTIAVTDFTNVSKVKELELLGKGLAVMLITDLSKARALTVVERAKMKFLLDEINLDGVNKETALRPGMLLGASKIITGSFLTLDGKSIDIVSSLTMTKTKVSRPSKSISGAMEQLFDLEKDLALGILDDMGIVLTDAERNEIKKKQTMSLDAFLAYCQGLDYMDKGMFKEASQQFEKAISIDPSFISPREELRDAVNLTTATQDISSMEAIRTEIASQAQQDIRISEADANTTHSLISTPSSAVISPRGGGDVGIVPNIKTVDVEVIFPE